jgi:cellulose biosynthesis protein BcsQ
MKVITCYSYKGGAGRTVAAANIAAALASSASIGAQNWPALNAKVAVIDLDVFSAGMHRCFGIPNVDVASLPLTIRDYLLQEKKASEYFHAGGINLEHDMTDSGAIVLRHPMFAPFATPSVLQKCRNDLTLFPAAARPDPQFSVQKYHENQMLGLILKLESEGFDFAILDGESGTKNMAEIAIRLADVVLMFFRLTWQHIEGTLEAVTKPVLQGKPCYLIPTCVPPTSANQNVYQPSPAFHFLRAMTQQVPQLSQLNDKCSENRTTFGLFWHNGQCVHDSLYLKGAESVLIYNNYNDEAAADYYAIAAKINELYGPGK